MLGELPCKKYLEFDDRKLMIFGILIISFCLNPIFFGVDFTTYLDHIYVEWPEAVFITSAYWIAFRFVVIKLRHKYPKIRQTKKRIVVLVLLMLLLSPIYGQIIGFIVESAHQILYAEDCLKPKLFQEIILTYFLCFGVFAIYEAIYYFVKYKEAIQEQERLRTAHVQSELDNLRNQVNPHFLFNSLNTLMNLIAKDTERATTYLNKLSKFYRYSVGKHEAALVSVHDEFENAQLYADLLRERFGENINITFRNGVEENVKVLPLSLQLLIENAVKHNIVSQKKPLK